MTAGDLVVVFNATPGVQSQRVVDLAERGYALHPIQAAGSDATVKGSAYDTRTGRFTVPARTVAVFKRG